MLLLLLYILGCISLSIASRKRRFWNIYILVRNCDFAPLCVGDFQYSPRQHVQATFNGVVSQWTSKSDEAPIPTSRPLFLLYRKDYFLSSTIDLNNFAALFINYRFIGTFDMRNWRSRQPAIIYKCKKTIRILYQVNIDQMKSK